MITNQETLINAQMNVICSEIVRKDNYKRPGVPPDLDAVLEQILTNQYYIQILLLNQHFDTSKLEDKCNEIEYDNENKRYVTG